MASYVLHKRGFIKERNLLLLTLVDVSSYEQRTIGVKTRRVGKSIEKKNQTIYLISYFDISRKVSKLYYKTI